MKVSVRGSHRADGTWTLCSVIVLGVIALCSVIVLGGIRQVRGLAAEFF